MLARSMRGTTENMGNITAERKEKRGERDREFIARQNTQSLAKIVWTRGGEIPKTIKQFAMTH